MVGGRKKENGGLWLHARLSATHPSDRRERGGEDIRSEEFMWAASSEVHLDLSITHSGRLVVSEMTLPWGCAAWSGCKSF